MTKIIVLVLLVGFAYLYGKEEKVRETTNTVVKIVIEYVKNTVISIVEFIKEKMNK